MIKPKIKGVNNPARYKVIDYTSQGTKPKLNEPGLFDGIIHNEWHNDSMYWYYDTDFVEIEIYDRCNIYRSGTTDWNFDNNTLKILKFESGKYEDITSSITQYTSKITEKQWEKTIFDLLPGKYKFKLFDSSKTRIDSEWYIEKIDTNKYLLKSNNTIYFMNNGGVSTLKEEELTDENVLKYGFKSINELCKGINDLNLFLNNNFDILIYMEE